ncbi:hemophore-related protein [Nocardia alni]|uniref:hemophore-related protein n=1 Tax=Nocardia alni TaxID=2815723 RepID=UPI001C24FF60|nr:hemophore-related protein [Nocardia alni]
MTVLRHQHLTATLALSGLSAGIAMLGSTFASADPVDAFGPLLTSSCSFEQVDTALHRVAPDAATQLDSAPQQKNQLRQAYNRPPGERRAAFQQLMAEQQTKGVPAGADAALAAKMREIADTCGRY